MTDAFAPIASVGRLMDGFHHPWFVSGGWAIDLFVGRVTREHEDLEVGIFRCDQGALARHLAGWRLAKALQGPQGGAWVPWAVGERLDLPIFQILARRPDDTPGNAVEYEFFLNDSADGRWQFRRDPTITYPLAALVRRSACGLPIIAPEVQLLHKARHHRPKDEHDFALAVDLLDPPGRAWLRDALARHHPGDSWLARLSPRPLAASTP